VRTPSAAAVGGAWARGGTPSAIPYSTMSVEAIKALPIAELAEADAHLYLWTFGRWIPAAYEVAKAWGFRPSALLTWCKAPMGLGFGGTFVPTTEHILFCRRGSLAHLRRWDSTWFNWPRKYDARGKPWHSAKPNAFYDLVEQVSPGPFLDLFARGQGRLNWSTWGNEALQHVELGA
jgi:N6-adenosine-specific RNA methylase IME4